MEEKNNFIRDITQKLIGLFDLKAEDFEIENNEQGYVIRIKEMPESGFLIGFHGRTLEALQHLINLIYFYHFQTWDHIYLQIGDYQEKKEKFLYSVADKAVEKALFLKEPVALSPMSAAERRIIHLYLETKTSVHTHSEGEGKDRHLIVSPVDNGEKIS